MAANSQTTIALESDLGLRDAKIVSQRLVEAIAEFDLIEINVSNLTNLDISIVQLLISARKSAAKRGRTITIAGSHSGTVHTVLTRAGLLGPDGLSRTADEEFWLGGKPAERHAA